MKNTFKNDSKICARKRNLVSACAVALLCLNLKANARRLSVPNIKDDTQRSVTLFLGRGFVS